MNEYTVDSIKVLDDIEHIRLRSGMYIGEATHPGHLFSEVYDNALDELQNGYGSTIKVIVDYSKNSYEVIDDGRGIPIGNKELPDGTIRSALEVLLTKANSGGKFDNTSFKIRCLAGDTKVVLTDGRSLSIVEIVKELAQGRSLYTYSVSDEGISIERINDAKVTRTTSKICKITLDNGEVIKCTPDHRFMLRDGTYKEAKDLTSEDSLMPYHESLVEGSFHRGYKLVQDPVSSRWVLSHYLADEYNLKHNLYDYDISERSIAHHKDFNKYNNNPDNIQRVTWDEHNSIHKAAGTRRIPYTREQFSEMISESRMSWWEAQSSEYKSEWSRHMNSLQDPKAKSARGSESLTRYNKSDKGRATASENGKLYGRDNFDNYRKSDRGRLAHAKMMAESNTDSELNIKRNLNKALKLAYTVISENSGMLNEELYYVRKCCEEFKRVWKYDRLLGYFNNNYDAMYQAAVNYNHRISKIEFITLDNEINMYDLEINSNSPNFALASGVFVHNCGLNGVGSTVVNALSKEVEVLVCRDDKTESIKLIDQNVIYHAVTDGEKYPRGTRFKFTPDPTMFESDKIPRQFIINRCKIASALGFTTELIIDGESVDITSDIYSLIPLDEGVSVYTKCKFKVDDPDTGESVICAMMYTSDTSSWYGGYTNLLPNPNGGTHFKMMDDAVYNALELYKIEGVHWKDYYLGLKLIVAVFISDPSFSSQTKEKLTVDKKSLLKFVPKISEKICEWLNSDISIRDGLFRRMQEYRAAQNKALSQKDISKLVIKNTDSSGKSIRRKSVVSKLIECTSTDRAGTDLYLCLSGDTEIPLLNGTSKSLAELAGIYKDDKEFWIYGADSEGQFIPVKAHSPRITQYVNSLLCIEFDDGSYIKCTPEHRFLDRDTMSWVEARTLVEGQSLFSLHRDYTWNGYECVYNIVTGKWEATHTVVNKAVHHAEHEECIAQSQKSNWPVTHHKDCNKLNNDPTNLVWLLRKEHIANCSEHGKIIGANNFRKWATSSEGREKSRQSITKYNQSEAHKKDMERAWSDPETRDKMAAGVYCRTEEGIQRQKDAIRNLKYTNPESYHRQVDHLRDPRYREAQLIGLTKGREKAIESSTARFISMNSDEQMKIKQLRGRIGKIIRAILDDGLEFNRDTYNSYRKKGTITYEGILKIFNTYEEALEYGRNYNHKIVSIKEETYRVKVPVYCLTVESEYHSYMLGNGIITHNCEGDSAAGSFMPVRNPKTQAILPLRGKVLNVAKLDDILSALKNSEILDIVNGIGAGLLEDSDPTLSRYEKIIICSDSDSDGCVRGNTRIKSLDGNTYTMKELVDKGIKELWVYSKNEEGQIVPGRAHSPRITKYVDSLVRLEFEKGVLECTPDHPILLRSGEYKQAQYITLEDDISAVRITSETVGCEEFRIKNKQTIGLDEPQPVYDLSVDNYNNFMVFVDDNLSDGIIIHNSHISALLTGLVINLLPNLVKAGMLYMVEPALYSWRDKSGLHFTNELSDIPKGVEMTRFKGLGEMDPEEVDICLTNPKTRKLIRINYPDDINQMNAVLTSGSVRRKMLEDMGVIKYE